MRRVLLFLFLLLLVVSCTKPECEAKKDCAARKCANVKCADGKCVYTPQPDCCGNLICESGENYCSCRDDCKEKCEGYVVLETNKYGPTYAKYLKRYCQGEKCITGINQSEVRQIPLIDEKQIRSFKISSVVKLNKPFDITKDSIMIELQVKDLGPDISPPLKFTGIKIVSGDLLFGSKSINREIMASGESFTESLSLSYVPQKPEEERMISIRIDYEYEQIIDKSGATKRVTDTYQNMLADKIFLVNPVVTR